MEKSKNVLRSIRVDPVNENIRQYIDVVEEWGREMVCLSGRDQ